MSEPSKRSAVASASLAVLASVVFDVALHRLAERAFRFEYLDNGLPHSVVVERGLFPLAASLGFGLIFGFLAVVFLRFRSELGGRSLAAALRFFGPLALVMFFGVLESAFVFPTPFRPELITAFADAIPFLLLGLLLARVARSEGTEAGAPRGRRASWISAPWVALFFVAGRYLVSYPLLDIRSGYVERPAGTLAWTVGCGLCMGVFYWLAGSTFSARTAWAKALRFGLPLGIFWLMVQLFYALISAVPVSDLATRGTADAVHLVLGVYGYEALFRTRSAGQAARGSASSPT